MGTQFRESSEYTPVEFAPSAEFTPVQFGASDDYETTLFPEVTTGDLDKRGASDSPYYLNQPSLEQADKGGSFTRLFGDMLMGRAEKDRPTYSLPDRLPTDQDLEAKYGPEFMQRFREAQEWLGEKKAIAESLQSVDPESLGPNFTGLGGVGMGTLEALGKGGLGAITALGLTAEELGASSSKAKATGVVKNEALQFLAKNLAQVEGAENMADLRYNAKPLVDAYMAAKKSQFGFGGRTFKDRLDEEKEDQDEEKSGFGTPGGAFVGQIFSEAGGDVAKISEHLQSSLDHSIRLDPDMEDSFGYKVWSTLLEQAPQVAALIATRGMASGRIATNAVIGYLQNKGAAYDQIHGELERENAKHGEGETKMTPEEMHAVAAEGSTKTAVLETPLDFAELGIDIHALDTVADAVKKSGKIFSRPVLKAGLRSVVLGAATEAPTEGLQNVIEDVVANQYSADPATTSEIIDHSLEAAKIGGTVGMLMPFGTSTFEAVASRLELNSSPAAAAAVRARAAATVPVTAAPIAPAAVVEQENPYLSPDQASEQAKIANEELDAKEKNKEQTPVASQVRDLEVYEQPVNSLKLSEDVPNFKVGADSSTGVVEGQQLEGKYERLGTGPVIVWERTNGDREVVSGRHRFDLASRTGEETIPAQLVREQEGWDKERVARLDAELNIRDGQGSVFDYAHYFQAYDGSREDAQKAGLLARSKGRAGWTLGQLASPDLFALYSAARIRERTAVAIADAAPNDAGLQRVGVRYAAANPTASAESVAERVKAASAIPAAAEAVAQGDLFGENDAAIQQMDKAADAAMAIRAEKSDDVKTLEAAMRRKGKLELTEEEARRFGIEDRSDSSAIKARLLTAREDAAGWENWHLDAEKKAAVFQRAGLAAPAASSVARLQEGRTQGDLLEAGNVDVFNLAGETTQDGQRITAETEAEAAERKANQEKFDREQQALFNSRRASTTPIPSGSNDEGNTSALGAGIRVDGTGRRIVEAGSRIDDTDFNQRLQSALAARDIEAAGRVLEEAGAALHFQFFASVQEQLAEFDSLPEDLMASILDAMPAPIRGEAVAQALLRQNLAFAPGKRDVSLRSDDDFVAQNILGMKFLAPSRWAGNRLQIVDWGGDFSDTPTQAGKTLQGASMQTPAMITDKLVEAQLTEGAGHSVDLVSDLGIREFDQLAVDILDSEFGPNGWLIKPKNASHSRGIIFPQEAKAMLATEPGAFEGMATAGLMAQQLFEPILFAEGETGIDRSLSSMGRVHVVTTGGEVHVVPFATIDYSASDEVPSDLSEHEHIVYKTPVIIPTERIASMEQAARTAIESLPATERQGSMFSVEVIESEQGFRIVELNPNLSQYAQGGRGGGGHLQNNFAVQDAVLSAMKGELPLHARVALATLQAQGLSYTTAESETAVMSARLDRPANSPYQTSPAASATAIGREIESGGRTWKITEVNNGTVHLVHQTAGGAVISKIMPLAAPMTAPEVRAGVERAYREHSETLDRLGNRRGVIVRQSTSGVGLWVDEDGNGEPRIYFDPHTMAESLTGLTPKAASAFLQRAFQEEVIHVAGVWFEKFAPETAEAFDQAMRADGDLMGFMERTYDGFGRMTAYQQRQETARVIIQKRWTGRVSEAAFKYLREFLAYLRRYLGDMKGVAKPVQEYVSGIESALRGDFQYQIDQRQNEREESFRAATERLALASSIPATATPQQSQSSGNPNAAPAVGSPTQPSLPLTPGNLGVAPRDLSRWHRFMRLFHPGSWGLVGYLDEVVRRAPSQAHAQPIARLAQRLGVFFDRAAHYNARLTSQFAQWAQRTDAAPRAQAQQEFEQFVALANRRNAGKTQANAWVDALAFRNTASQAGQFLIDQLRANGVYQGQEMTAANIHVMEANGRWRSAYNLGEEFFPRLLTERAQELISDPDAAENQAEYRQLLQDMVTNGNAANEAEAHNQITQQLAGGYEGGEFFGSLDRARGMKLPDQYYDTSFDTYLRFLSGWSARMSQIFAFGQRIHEGQSPAFVQASEATNHDELKRRIREAYDDIYGENKTKSGFERFFYRVFIPIATIRYLTAFLTQVRNALSATALTAENFGIINTAVAQTRGLIHAAQAVGRMAGNAIRGEFRLIEPQLVTDAADLGTVQRSLYAAQMYDLDELGNAIKRVTEVAMKPQQLVEMFNRAVTTSAALTWLQDARVAVQNNPASYRARTALAQIQRFGFTGGRLTNLLAGNSETVNQFLRQSVREKQFSYQITQTPQFFDSPWGRLFLQFQKWGAQRTRDLARNIIGPMIGEEVNGVRTYNPAPFVRFVLLTFAQTALVSYLAALLFGRDRRDPDWEEIWNTTSENEQRGISMALYRITRDITMTGGMGLFGDYGRTLLDTVTPGRAHDLINPPGLTMVRDIIDLVKDSRERKGDVSALWRDIKARLLYPTPAIKEASDFALEHVWAADSDAHKIKQGRDDLGQARAMVRRYLEEKGEELTPKGETPKSPKSEQFDRLQEALLIGDRFTARRIIDELTRKDANAIRGLKASVSRRAPLVATSSMGRNDEDDFLRWAHRRQPSKYVAIKTLNDRYHATAKAVGLERQD